ncbi:MAG: 30S ribosomal protein S2 [Candidatus Hydrogenedens sp.]|nr:30S ribosomal protein S2 [Candidatus Hydrogenedens sp.]
MALVTMRELLEAGIHFGHQTRRWNPKMKRYIYGERNGIYIIDLKHTMRQLYLTYALVRDLVTKGGHVLLVGTKRQAQEAIARESERCGMYFVNNRWLGGTLTNYQTVRRSIAKLDHLQAMEEDGTIEKFNKKEAAMMRKERMKLEKNLQGIQTMPGLPQAVFVIDAGRESIAIKEARRLGIPCISVIDTNCDPDDVDLPIPGNDDAIRAIDLYTRLIADAVIEGKMRREKLEEEAIQAKMASNEGRDVTEEDEQAEAEEQTETAEKEETDPDEAYDDQYKAEDTEEAAEVKTDDDAKSDDEAEAEAQAKD